MLNHKLKLLFLTIFFIITLIPSIAFAQTDQEKNFDFIIFTTDKDEYSWYETITATILVTNTFDNVMTIQFSGTCFINAIITGNNVKYDDPRKVCMDEDSTIKLKPKEYKYFQYTINLSDLAAIQEGQYDLNVYFKPVIYLNGARYSEDPIQFIKPFDFKGNIEIKVSLLKEPKIFEPNENIKLKWQLVNNSDRSYSSSIYQCGNLVDIYDYYSKKLIFTTPIMDCTNDNESTIKVANNAQTTAQTIIAYDPSQYGQLMPGQYVLVYKLNESTLSPFSHFSDVFEIKGQENIFTDTQNHWAENFIRNLYNAKIINGYSDGSFKPDQTISKAELIKIILNSLNKKILKLKDIVNHHFIDIHENDWFFPYIETAANLNMLNLDTKTLAPNQNILRKEAFEILVKGLTTKNQDSSFYNIFSDVQAEDIPVFMTLYNLGIIQGYNATLEAKPNNTLTRAETAKIAAKAIEVSQKDIDANNKNALLRYYKFATELSNSQEYDIIICEDGKSGFFTFDPNSHDGGLYFETKLNLEDITAKLLASLYQNNFFDHQGNYDLCANNDCQNSYNEGLEYFYSNLTSFIKINSADNIDSTLYPQKFNDLSQYLINYFLTLNHDLKLIEAKKTGKFFDDNFCL